MVVDKERRTVQRHRDPILLGIGNPVQADLVADVGHLIRLIRRVLLDLQRAIVVFRRWRMVDGFIQLAVEDLHDTVRVGVIVDGGSLFGVPDQQQLVESVLDTNRRVDSTDIPGSPVH